MTIDEIVKRTPVDKRPMIDINGVIQRMNDDDYRQSLKYEQEFLQNYLIDDDGEGRLMTPKEIEAVLEGRMQRPAPAMTPEEKAKKKMERLESCLADITLLTAAIVGGAF